MSQFDSIAQFAVAYNLAMNQYNVDMMAARSSKTSRADRVTAQTDFQNTLQEALPSEIASAPWFQGFNATQTLAVSLEAAGNSDERIKAYSTWAQAMTSALATTSSSSSSSTSS